MMRHASARNGKPLFLIGITLVCCMVLFAASAIEWHQLFPQELVEVQLPDNSDAQFAEEFAMTRLSSEIADPRPHKFSLEWVAGPLSGTFYRLVYNRQRGSLRYEATDGTRPAKWNYETIYVFGNVTDDVIRTVVQMNSGNLEKLTLYGCTKQNVWYESRHRPHRKRLKRKLRKSNGV